MRTKNRILNISLFNLHLDFDCAMFSTDLRVGLDECIITIPIIIKPISFLLHKSDEVWVLPRGWVMLGHVNDLLGRKNVFSFSLFILWFFPFSSFVSSQRSGRRRTRWNRWSADTPRLLIVDFEAFVGVSVLDIPHCNIHPIPRQVEEDLGLSSFDIEADVTDGGGVKGEEVREQREALDFHGDF